MATLNIIDGVNGIKLGSNNIYLAKSGSQPLETIVYLGASSVYGESNRYNGMQFWVNTKTENDVTINSE